MSAQFCRLIDLAERLHHLDRHQLLEFLKYLIDKNHGELIIDGLFLQLYMNSNINNHNTMHDLLSSMLNKCNDIHPPTMITNSTTTNAFNDMADSLLTHIASYLPQKQIFTCWNHVDRRFMQTAAKPNVLNTFTYYRTGACYQTETYYRNDTMQSEMKRNAPKFKLDSMLSKLKHLKCCPISFRHLINKICLQSLTKLEIGLCFNFREKNPLILPLIHKISCFFNTVYIIFSCLLLVLVLFYSRM